MATKIGASADLLAVRDDFKLKTNKLTGEVEVFHANGQKWQDTELMKLFEGTDLAAVQQHNQNSPQVKYVPPTGGTELYQSKKDVKTKRNTDKNSVAYQEAVKNSQSQNKS